MAGPAAGLRILSATCRCTGSFLLRHIHRRKTALTDLLEQPVASDYVSRPVHLYLVRIALEMSLVAPEPSRANNLQDTNVVTGSAMRKTLRRNICVNGIDNDRPSSATQVW